jgi:hypothetical protein
MQKNHLYRRKKFETGKNSIPPNREDVLEQCSIAMVFCTKEFLRNYLHLDRSELPHGISLQMIPQVQQYNIAEIETESLSFFTPSGDNLEGRPLLAGVIGLTESI